MLRGLPMVLGTSELTHKLFVSPLPSSSPGLWFLQERMGLPFRGPGTTSRFHLCAQSWLILWPPATLLPSPHFKSCYFGVPWKGEFRKDGGKPDLCPEAEPLSLAFWEPIGKGCEYLQPNLLLLLLGSGSTGPRHPVFSTLSFHLRS